MHDEGKLQRGRGDVIDAMERTGLGVTWPDVGVLEKNPSLIRGVFITYTEASTQHFRGLAFSSRLAALVALQEMGQRLAFALISGQEGTEGHPRRILTHRHLRRVVFICWLRRTAPHDADALGEEKIKFDERSSTEASIYSLCSSKLGPRS